MSESFVLYCMTCHYHCVISKEDTEGQGKNHFFRTCLDLYDPDNFNLFL